MHIRPAFYWQVYAHW